jgi:probable rRNA maturation factor
MGGLVRYGQAVLRELASTDWDLSILITDDATMSSLNERYRRADGPTDVLSFVDSEAPMIVQETRSASTSGDIVIDLPCVERQAQEWGAGTEEELRRVLVHGILHVAGYSHQTNDADTEPMLQLQESILTRVKERIY